MVEISHHILTDNINEDYDNFEYRSPKNVWKVQDEYKKDFDIKKNIIFKNKKRFNIIITPHIGSSTKDAWKLKENRVIE